MKYLFSLFLCALFCGCLKIYGQTATRTVGYTGPTVLDYQYGGLMASLKFEVPPDSGGILKAYKIRGGDLTSNAVRFCLAKKVGAVLFPLDSTYAVGNILALDDNTIPVSSGRYLTPGNYWLCWTEQNSNYFGFAAVNSSILDTNAAWTNISYDYSLFPGTVSGADWIWKTNRVLDAVGAIVEYPAPPPSSAKYSVKLINPLQKSDRTFQFDLVISAPKKFELNAYQAALTYNTKIGTDISFAYVAGSCEILNTPVPSSVQRIGNLLAFGSYAGSDSIFNQKRLGTFVITSATPFAVEYINLGWNFSGVLKTIFTGNKHQDITNPEYFSNLIYDVPLPVEIDSFLVKIVNDTVLISWKTVTEADLSLFSVIRTPGTLFQTIPAAGNSNSPKYYKTRDVPDSTGDYSYTLEARDTKGNLDFTESIKIHYDKPRIPPPPPPPPPASNAWWWIIIGAVLAVLVFLGIKKFQ